ncbi:hypothetical protein [Chitinophaga sp. CF118]|uniref:hypothetical protein n=1 Tax=Chitinophaga sp. CF118 TaxID=1884367 RepID=UPI000B7F864E|nr:hypothetical protein [Chitinophaga sp. CF118]
MKFTKSDYVPYTEPYSLINNGNHITLNLGDYKEPNNGRDLLVAELIINGEDRTTDYFGSWNLTSTKLDKYQFSDPDNRFCFIPKESPSFLIDTLTLDKFEFGRADRDFVGNMFYGDKHLIIDRNFLVVTDLNTRKSVEFPFAGNRSIEWASFINHDLIRIIYNKSDDSSLFDLKTGRIKSPGNILSNDVPDMQK